MKGRILFCILLFSIIPLGSNISITSSQIEQNQTVNLMLNSTTQGDINTTKNYTFTTTRYLNITLDLVSNGNLSIYLDFVYPQKTVCTNATEFTKNYYLRPNTYLFVIYPEVGGINRQYSITLTSNVVPTQNNHDMTNATQLTVEQPVMGIMNYTTQMLESWYTFYIPVNGNFRINLNLLDNSQYIFESLFFTLQGTNQQSIYVPFSNTNFTHTMVRYLLRGTYSLKVILNGLRSSNNPLPMFRLWYTTQLRLPSPPQVTINDLIYGTVIPNSPATSSLVLSKDVALWFGIPVDNLAYEWDLEISISNQTMTRSVNSYANWPFAEWSYDTSQIVFLSAGEYTLQIYPNIDIVDFIIGIHQVEPDALDNGGNNHDNPYVLAANIAQTGNRLYSPNDKDWFALPVDMPGRITITLDQTLNVIAYNSTGNDVWQQSNHIISFDVTPQIYVVAIFVANGEAGVRSYSIKWSLQPASTTIQPPIPPTPLTSSSTTPYESTSKLKIGYSFPDVILFFTISLTVMVNLQKHRKSLK